MSEKASEKSNMSSVEFAQHALRHHIAPPSVGSVKARLRIAARRLGWRATRTRDAWYAHPRIEISADEIRKIEETTGLRYGREELRANQDLIDTAADLLADMDPNFHRPFLAAMRAFIGAVDRPGIEG